MASLNSLLDFTKICRLCLSNDTNLNQIFIDENTRDKPNHSLPLPSKILACVSIEVACGDNLPDKICSRCTEQLENWAKFKDLCDNANTLLLQYAAGMGAITEEVFNKNLRQSISETLNIPETSSDFSLVDVSLLEHDSLLQKLDSKEGFSESFEHNTFSTILSVNNNQHSSLQPAKSKKQIEKDLTIGKELKRQEWREKYSTIYVKKYPCFICPKYFTKFNNLLEHDKDDHKDIDHQQKCEKCNQLFISELRLEAHSLLKHKEKVYECEVCGLKSVSKKSLNSHKVRHTQRFLCNTCGFTTNSQKSLEDHERTHNAARVYSCSHCQQTFRQRQSLGRHLKTHSDFKYQFQCKICSKIFKSHESLKSHEICHSEDKKHICDTCGVALGSKASFSRHKLTHLGLQHSCEVCNKTLSSKSLLIRHLSTHSSQLFLCPVCNKSYRRGDTLSMHMKVHDSPTQFFMCQFCDKTFILHKYLQRHKMRIHNK